MGHKQANCSLCKQELIFIFAAYKFVHLVFMPKLLKEAVLQKLSFDNQAIKPVGDFF